MIRTFLVALSIPDGDDPEDWAAEIQDSLETDGLPVTSVKPWAEPLAPTDPFPLPSGS